MLSPFQSSHLWLSFTPPFFALLLPPYLTIYVHILTSPASSLAPLLPLLPTTSLIPPSASTCFGSFTPLSIYPQSYFSLLHTSKPIFTLYRIFQNAENLRFPHLHRSLPFLPSLSLTPHQRLPLHHSLPPFLYPSVSILCLFKACFNEVSLLPGQPFVNTDVWPAEQRQTCTLRLMCAQTHGRMHL